MARKKQEVNAPDTNWKQLGGQFAPSLQLKSGESFEGVLLGRDEIHSKKFKHTLKVYSLSDTNGEEFALWGSGLLDYLLKDVPDGTRVRIFYDGKTKVKGIKQECHQYRVYTPKEDRADK